MRAKERDVVNITDFDTPQHFFDYVTANHLEGEINPGDYTLTSSITITTATHFKILGKSSTGGSNNSGSYGVRFLWNGASGGTVFALSGTRDYELGNLCIIPTGANTIGVGLDIDGANSTLGKHPNIVISKSSGTLTTVVFFF